MSDESPAGAGERVPDPGRRRFLGLWPRAVLAGAALGGAGGLLWGRPGRHRPEADTDLPAPRDWRVPDGASGRLVVAGGSGPRENLRRALAAMGGIEGFVKPGERVAIKPNCAWDRLPEQAANTDPELTGELVRLCLAAGAARVIVLDSTCHDAERSFERSGIAAAVRDAGGRTAHQTSAAAIRLDLGGTQLGAWDVLEPLARADRVINVPVVKHHSLARATLGMKNWFGALVGRRSRLHQRLAQVTAELGAALRPTLTVVDATRVLAAGGPTGGSLELVRGLDLLALATDPVAADAWGASLLDLGPRELPHLEIATRLGLGSADWRALVREV